MDAFTPYMHDLIDSMRDPRRRLALRTALDSWAEGHDAPPDRGTSGFEIPPRFRPKRRRAVPRWRCTGKR